MKINVALYGGKSIFGSKEAPIEADEGNKRRFLRGGVTMVWCSVVSSMLFVFFTKFDFGAASKAFSGFLFAVIFFGGLMYESKKESEFERLKREIKELKENK